MLSGDDFDRRIALISFDNAIEVAITTFLTLHPIQRAGRSYPKAQIEKWLYNYHSKLDFIGEELATRKLPWEVELSHIIWVHDHRNEQYHGGQKGTPERSILDLVRRAALWIFTLLFEVSDVEQRLAQTIAGKAPPPLPQRLTTFDQVIDREYGLVDVCDQIYLASELLFSVDYAAYRDLGARLCSVESGESAGEDK